jgi:signal transduction histidine kinase
LKEDVAGQRLDRLRRAAPAVQHEVNNAMMVLAANLDLLSRSVGEGAPTRQLDRAVQASRRLEETIRGYLDAARRNISDPSLVSLIQVVRQSLPLLRVALGARHGVEVTEPEKLTPVSLDRAALELALLSVAQDAVGRMPNGTRLGITLREGDAEVELELTLPEGVGPVALAQLEACCGRLQVAGNGCVLAWRKP